VGKHVHELEYLIDSTRLHLRGKRRLLSVNARTKLASQLTELSNSIQQIEGEVLASADPSSPEPKISPELVDKNIQKLETLTRNLMSTYESWRPFHRWEVLPAPDPEKRSEILPIALIFAVYVDCFVDGFLIGLSFIASQHAGIVMAVATCIEMGFLGLSFSASIKISTSKLWKHILVIIFGPLILAVAGAVGSAAGVAVEHIPSLYLGFVSFAVVALLFLVTQELLIEAHENTEGKEIWWINVWMFLGIFLILLSGMIHHSSG